MLNFEQLYQSYAADVYRFAFWLAGDAARADDITSETFVRAWAKNSAIRTETLKAYLFTIARNVFLEQQRKSKRQVVLQDVYEDGRPGPESLAQFRQELQTVWHVLQTVPEVDRTAFILRVQQELPYTEIARVLELSLSAVKVKVHRVRRKLVLIQLEEAQDTGYMLTAGEPLTAHEQLPTTDY
jgi:RNA polymerase sigma-70 factor (ECF subfamily)